MRNVRPINAVKEALRISAFRAAQIRILKTIALSMLGRNSLLKAQLGRFIYAKPLHPQASALFKSHADKTPSENIAIKLPKRAREIFERSL